MKENKHIEKELLFKNNIKDITSISLDSDYKLVNQELVGSFLVSGEYKTHEISLNREKFSFKIPFKEELENDIELDTVKVEITNFLYDYKKDELVVNIDYEIIGDRKDVLIFDDKESLDEFLKTRELEVIDTRLDEIKEEIKISENEEEKDVELKNNKSVEDKKVNILDENELFEKDKVKEEKENEEIEICEKNSNDNIELIDEKITFDSKDREVISSDEMISNVGNIEDGFVTYKVYKIKENETLESIVIKYKTTLDELKEYNDLNNISVNDKIIIPMYE